MAQTWAAFQVFEKLNLAKTPKRFLFCPISSHSPLGGFRKHNIFTFDYCGKKNFPLVTQREFLLKFFEGPKQYQASASDWLKELDLREVKDIALE